MNTKREIHGLDQAVVLLMFALDRVFAHRVLGWRRARKGFQVEIIHSANDIEDDLHVAIYPVGLPKEDAVTCRFLRHGGRWNPNEGRIPLGHSAKEIAGFSFYADGATNDRASLLEYIIKPRGYEEKFEEIIARDAIYKCEWS